VSEPADHHETLTLLVRLWPETDAAGPRRWRGRVEHVGTGEVCYVETAAGVIDVIECWIKPVATGGVEQRRGAPAPA
jgi:hypothetical protein